MRVTDGALEHLPADAQAGHLCIATRSMSIGIGFLATCKDLLDAAQDAVGVGEGRDAFWTRMRS